jgi:hypothetical protein
MVIFRQLLQSHSIFAVPLALIATLFGCASEGEQAVETAPAVKATMVYYAMPG